MRLYARLDQMESRILGRLEAIVVDVTQALADLATQVKDVGDRVTAHSSAMQAEIDALKAAGADTARLQAIADS